MSDHDFYMLLSQEVQVAMDAQGVAAFSYDALDQHMLKQSMCGSLPTWISESDSHSKDEYVFQHAITDLELKVFKLAPVPDQSTVMLITVPIVLRQYVLGGLCIAFEKSRELSSDEHSFLGLLGAWAAQMIESRRQLPQDHGPEQSNACLSLIHI